MSRKAKNTVARDELETRIGYAFADKAILDRALTHISATSPKQGRGGSYQRLEFLGDHVLGLAVSDMLFRAFPKADEGELSRRLADLGALKPGVSVDDANDMLWFFFGYSGFFTLMDDNGWSADRSEEWLREMAAMAVLRSRGE